MADDDKDKDKPPAPAAGPDESVIRRVVSDVLGGLFKDGKADVDDGDDDGGGGKGRGKRRRDDDGGDIAGQVAKALADVRSKDAQAAEKQALEDRLKALEEKTAKPEKAPRQLRRATRFMWGEDDDGQ